MNLSPISCIFTLCTWLPINKSLTEDDISPANVFSLVLIVQIFYLFPLLPLPSPPKTQAARLRIYRALYHDGAITIHILAMSAIHVQTNSGQIFGTTHG
jgi:hypothetical protein